ncbi:MAG TPA: hypothetical protein VI977_01265 [archaeon]|nr:hypothetical protein [archaeon]
MIAIDARFAPFRMVLNRREPVQLKIEVKNTGDSAEMVSLEVKLGARLSLDRVGYKTSDIKRIDAIKPEEVKAFYFSIWPKNAASATEEPVRIRATEHDGNFSLAKEEYFENLSLKIE